MCSPSLSFMNSQAKTHSAILSMSTCSVKILHLICLTACNVLTSTVSMTLNHIFLFHSSCTYRLQFFLNNKITNTCSPTFFTVTITELTALHMRPELMQSLFSLWEIQVKHNNGSTQVSNETKILLSFHLKETEMAFPKITACDCVWLNSEEICGHFKSQFFSLGSGPIFQNLPLCPDWIQTEFSFLKRRKLLHFSWK